MGEPGPSQAASSTSQPSQPPISQAVAQLLSVLSSLTAKLGDARAPVMSSHGQGSPIMIVVSIIISVSGYGHPMSIAMPNGAQGPCFDMWSSATPATRVQIPAAAPSLWPCPTARASGPA
ncbi:MAG: hypothetical protein DRN03_06170 [Thermoplasmata archaeon]|nr:MAG: hypothetical protein DRN03_06170 [Thermoplasmata archaeon]